MSKEKVSNVKQTIINEFWDLFRSQENGESSVESYLHHHLYEDGVAQKAEIIAAEYQIEKYDDNGKLTNRWIYRRKRIPFGWLLNWNSVFDICFKIMTTEIRQDNLLDRLRLYLQDY